MCERLMNQNSDLNRVSERRGGVSMQQVELIKAQRRAVIGGYGPFDLLGLLNKTDLRNTHFTQSSHTGSALKNS